MYLAIILPIKGTLINVPFRLLGDIAEAISIADRVVVLSKRPASVKSIHEIELTLDVQRTPLTSREAPEFRHYFNTIWKELDIHVQ
jgi:NitT/TauT family transport system ATP-binding protein